jgi:hypothetical protein
MDQNIREYLAEIGRRGGRASRRTLDPEQARAMVRVREARRAYRRFHAQWCLYYAAKQGRFVDPDEPGSGRVVLHYGAPGGVLPRIIEANDP